MIAPSFPPPDASRADVDSWCRTHGVMHPGLLAPACAMCGDAPEGPLFDLCADCKAAFRPEAP